MGFNFGGRITGASCPASQGGIPNANGVCNGNGDGTVDQAAGGPPAPNEAFNAFAMLGRAGLIDGQYRWIPGSDVVRRGVTFPAGPRETAYWFSNQGTTMITSRGWYGPTATTGIRFEGIYIGAPYPGGNTYGRGFLTYTEARNMDDKIDDGNAITGKLLGMRSDCRVPPEASCPAQRCVTSFWGNPSTTARYNSNAATDQLCNVLYIIQRKG